MNNFYNYIKQNDIDDRKAQQSIINNLIIKDLRGKEKCLGELPAYDSETLFQGKLFLGNTYIMKYEAKEGSLYEYNGQYVKYYDDMPIVLISKTSSTWFRGINLNFCNKALKTLIFNLLWNLDEDFYEGRIQKLIQNENLPISEKVIKFLGENGENEIKKLFTTQYKLIDANSIFRNYQIQNIKQIRLIEPWQWKYITNLRYEGSLKMETLKAIQKISGIDQIKI